MIHSPYPSLECAFVERRSSQHSASSYSSLLGVSLGGVIFGAGFILSAQQR
jgi:hypothetical protein